MSLLFWPDPEPILARAEPFLNGNVQPFGLHIAFEAGLTREPQARGFVAQFNPHTRAFVIDSERVLAEMHQADETGRSIFLGGSPLLIYQSFFQYAQAKGDRFHFGNRCHVQFGAGGWSGRKGQMEVQGPILKEEFIPALCDLLGLDSTRGVTDMWGSTETSFAMPAHFSDSLGDFLFHDLPWARVILRDPVTLQPLDQPNSLGLLEVVTPYGVDSFAGVAILIDDILEQVEVKDGPDCILGQRAFRFRGRAQGAEAKGCGAMAADWLERGL